MLAGDHAATIVTPAARKVMNAPLMGDKMEKEGRWRRVSSGGSRCCRERPPATRPNFLKIFLWRLSRRAFPFPAPLHLSENPYTTQEQEERMFTLLSLASLAVGVISLAFQLYDRRRK
jgi:hypothetical protein